MALRQDNLNIEELTHDVKRPDWIPDLSAQNGVFGRLATLVMVHPRLALIAAIITLVVVFFVLAPIVVVAVYVALGVGAYALWTRIRRLRMPRIIPLSHSSGFRLESRRQDLTQLIGLNLVATLFAFFGGVMVWDGGQLITGGAITAVFSGFTAVLLRLSFKEVRARLYFR